MDRTQFKNFNMTYWRSRGGQGVPYYDELPEQRKQRVYIDAAIFTKWEQWKSQADIARDAAIMGENCMTRAFVKRGDTLPLSADPPFMAERNWITFDYRIWINVLCPSETEFYRAVADCMSLIQERQDAVQRHGFLAAKTVGELAHPLYDTILPMYKEMMAQELKDLYTDMVSK